MIAQSCRGVRVIVIWFVQLIMGVICSTNGLANKRFKFLSQLFSIMFPRGFPQATSMAASAIFCNDDDDDSNRDCPDLISET
ncbi:hypothetical protein BASA50_004273 [Batrachochytrium salamandrivorans]|uniref:Secreted protein n=1 Tax=Batrachochytrium salamandrivorans TaxID=1357716 RepID=A0ABQ8FGG8_9FUNG|nr:hypothetical protein BASA50_004273 [Batrachochytrium salamandrivorans]